MLELLYTSTKTVAAASSPVNLGGLVYVGSWDALLLLNGTRLDKLFRDGTQATLGVMASFFFPGSRVSARAYWLLDYGTGTAEIYAADEITGQYCPAPVLNPDWPLPAALKTPGNFLDDWAGIYAHNEGSGVIGFYRLSDGARLGQVQLSHADAQAYDSLSYVGRNQLLAFQKSTGRVALVDYLKQVVLWESAVRPALVAAYDSRHQLVHTVETDLKVRVYLTTPLAPGLSAPEFYPAADPITRLQGYPVRVRLLGAQGEPCAGKWVTWATPDLGYLQKVMSRTDDEGYAWNYYFGPALLTGEEILRAEVTV